jgi:hypothetical protein
MQDQDHETAVVLVLLIAVLVAHNCQQQGRMRTQEDELDRALHNLHNYYKPTISYIRRHQWTIQNPGEHFFHDDQDFIEYLRQ